MKSAAKGMPRREAFKKYIRAKAHREGTLFKDALSTIAHSENGMGTYLPRVIPRDRVEKSYTQAPHKRRNSAGFVNLGQISDEGLVPDDKEIDVHFATGTSAEEQFHRHTDMSVSILSIARPAKRKGVAKDFEIVRKVRNVVALPDEFEKSSLEADEDWEQIDDEQPIDTRQSYSSVLRGNKR
ncbi:hypothetical protein BDZ97DRAFT_754486 [Flammula alnicola]|nr:hypothetical protein BDZ97DRAFT_754486 [Flammula alnicola]